MQIDTSVSASVTVCVVGLCAAAVPGFAATAARPASVPALIMPASRPRPLPIPGRLVPIDVSDIPAPAALTPRQKAALPRGFFPVPAKSLGAKSFHASGESTLNFKTSALEILKYARLDPAVWDGAIPSFVYSNADVKAGTPLVRPLHKELPGPPAFLHGTSRQAAFSILRKGVLLAPGLGDVSAGFFLDAAKGLIAKTYTNKQEEEGVFLQVYLDPNAPTVTYGSGLYHYFCEWLNKLFSKEDPAGLRLLKKLHPRFMKLAGRGIRGPSRDNLARSLGAKILINETLYGGTVFQEVVVLDPSAVLGVRVLAPTSKSR